ncbi:MAG TPA: hypothetical protein VF570_14940, partial [Pyrinomonadaceae bacterium]
RSHVERRRAAEGRLVLVGPKYIGVTVLATVVPETGAEVSRLEGGVVDALSRFLHPLTGGPEGEGWNFGRKPQASDVYAVIESVAGVRYVRRLQLSGSKEAEGGGETPVDLEKLADGQDYFLVYSGEHKIELVFD